MGSEQHSGIDATVIAQRKMRRENPAPVFFELEKPELEEVYFYPFLIPGERRLRGDAIGNIWLRSFSQTDESNESGQKKVLISWSKFRTIEDAIRGSEEVKSKYHPETGEEVQRILAIKNAARDLIDRLRSKELTADNMEEEIDKIAQLLAKTKYLDAVKFSKKRMSDFIFRSVMPDSLGRTYNPSRSILLDAHVVEDAIDEEAFQAIGFAKYDFIPEELRVARQGIRSDLSQIDLLMQKVESMNERNPELGNAINVLSQFIEDKVGKDKSIPSPYLRALVIAKILVNGQTGVNDGSRLIQLLENKEEAIKYIGQIPLVVLQSKRRIDIITNYCKAEIRKALSEGAIALEEEEPASPKGLFG